MRAPYFADRRKPARRSRYVRVVLGVLIAVTLLGCGRLGAPCDFAGRFSLAAWISGVAGGNDFQHVFTRQLRNSGPIDGYALAVGTQTNPGAFTERVFAGGNANTAHIAAPAGTLHHLVV